MFFIFADILNAGSVTSPFVRYERFHGMFKYTWVLTNGKLHKAPPPSPTHQKHSMLYYPYRPVSDNAIEKLCLEYRRFAQTPLNVVEGFQIGFVSNIKHFLSPLLIS